MEARNVFEYKNLLQKSKKGIFTLDNFKVELATASLPTRSSPPYVNLLATSVMVLFIR